MILNHIIVGAALAFELLCIAAFVAFVLIVLA